MKLNIAGSLLLTSVVLLSGYQTRTGATERVVTLAATGRQPAYTLHISANQNTGKVEVFGAQRSSTPIQTLSCELAPYSADLFVNQFAAVDLDLDGIADLRGTREFGAKWSRYCVWLYEPGSRSFAKDFLAEQMELLYNLEPDPKDRRIVSHTIGPVRPEWNVYRIISQPPPGLLRQLIPLQSCALETDNRGNNPTAVVTHYQNGQALTQTYPLGASKDLNVQAVCDSFQVPPVAGTAAPGR